MNPFSVNAWNEMEWWSFNKHRYYSFLFLHCLEFFRSHKMMRKFVNFNCLMCVLFISCFGLLVHYFRSIIQFVLTPVDYICSLQIHTGLNVASAYSHAFRWWLGNVSIGSALDACMTAKKREGKEWRNVRPVNKILHFQLSGKGQSRRHNGSVFRRSWVKKQDAAVCPFIMI